MLEAAVEQYRQIHQEPLVTRAGEIFSQITRGRYSGIDVYDGVLRGIESGKGIPYVALSDGTRDQLYLCLRVAAVTEGLLLWRSHATLPPQFHVEIDGIDDPIQRALWRRHVEAVVDARIRAATVHQQHADCRPATESPLLDLYIRAA